MTSENVHELQDSGYCVLKKHFPAELIADCREAFWPVMLKYLEAHSHEPNRGKHRHFLPMPFDPPCFVLAFFFDPKVLGIVRALMDDRVVADQWGCDVPVRGSEYQEAHVDYRRPLFEEFPDLALPPHMLLVSFGLVRIAAEHGPIEIAPGTHGMPRAEALQAVQRGEIAISSVPLEVGDVLIRNPWTLHRGTPNLTDIPRALATIRYVRRWYFDGSRDVSQISGTTWRTLTPEQQSVLRFPVGN